MLGKLGSILSNTQHAVLQSIKRTQHLVDAIQLSLATGKEVNSAIDNPQNFFLSRRLSQQGGDLMRLLDGIATNISRIKETNIGIEAILKLLDQAESVIEEALASQQTASNLTQVDIDAILAANPDVSYSSHSQSFYRWVTATANWQTASSAARSATLVQPAGMAGISGVGGHLTVITSQQENDFVSNLITADTWLGGADALVEGSWRWLYGPEADLRFWQGLASGGTVDGSYANWNGAEPNQFLGNEDYLQMYDSNGRWNDVPDTYNLGHVVEWEVSLFKGGFDLGALMVSYSEQYLQIMEQIDQIAKDSHYLGIRLLMEDDLTTYFNPDLTSFLLTEGIDATSSGLGLVSVDFLTEDVIEEGLLDVRNARETLRAYAQSLQVDFGILSSRMDFTRSNINIHRSASEELVIADQNEKGAELLALQVRQQMQFTILSMTKGPGIEALFS